MSISNRNVYMKGLHKMSIPNRIVYTKSLYLIERSIRKVDI